MPKRKQPESQTAPGFDDVLKRMLASPPDPKKRAKPVKKDEKKKPAGE
jgi:hypothetical protein